MTGPFATSFGGKDCMDCIHSTRATPPACRHPKNFRPDLFGENPVFSLCDSHRGFGGEEEKLMPSICGKSGRWFDNGAAA